MLVYYENSNVINYVSSDVFQFINMLECIIGFLRNVIDTKSWAEFLFLCNI